ncbi:unnamed protein product [Rhizophagus irregularis]|nr:unnamed protein product [Rhizophagus irregularis]
MVILHLAANPAERIIRTIIKEKGFSNHIVEFVIIHFKLIMLIVMYVCKQVRLPQHIFENIVFLPDPIPSISNTDCYNTETSEKYRPNGSYGTTSYLNKYQSS